MAKGGFNKKGKHNRHGLGIQPMYESKYFKALMGPALTFPAPTL